MKLPRVGLRGPGPSAATSPPPRSLEELVDPDDAWDVVAGCAAGAPHPVEILPCNAGAGEDTLLALQLTTHSMMGTIGYRSGGMLVDRGWLRVLGAGCPRIGGGLREWNAALGGRPLDPPLDGAAIVAYDAVGGFFAMNGDRWPTPPGQIHYLAPDTWRWESYELGYAAFVEWACSEKLATFYGERWAGWEGEVEALGPDQAIRFWPALGLEPVPLERRRRRAVPARELWGIVNEFAREAGFGRS